jgi:TPR repeat protein
MGKPWFRNLFSSTPGAATAPDTRTRAAEGDASAQYSLGLQFSRGQGAGQDLTQAAHWYRLAAEQNHPLAQFNLGVMLGRGQGIAADPAAGEEWIRRAALGGDARAQFHCGNQCYRELLKQREAGVPELRIEAYKWFQLAALQGCRDSLNSRIRITSSMTYAEVAEANERVARFTLEPALVDEPAPATAC